VVKSRRREKVGKARYSPGGSERNTQGGNAQERKKGEREEKKRKMAAGNPNPGSDQGSQAGPEEPDPEDRAQDQFVSIHDDQAFPEEDGLEKKSGKSGGEEKKEEI
jgi:hypothetical protein